VKLLLDTHVLLWWLQDDPSLGTHARRAVERPDNLVFVSAATAWEIAGKRARGKLEAPGDVAEWIDGNSFTRLSIEVQHAVAAAELPHHHGDPFDRLLVAQAQLEGLTLTTNDDRIKEYDVAVLDASV
jgi:PIN domain nuclease of toxin-antitoxin system